MSDAKKRLTDFDFSREGCHVSLVNKEVGGAANQRTAIVFKSLSNMDVQKKETTVSEMIEKSAVEAMVQKAVDAAIAPLQEELKQKQAELDAVLVEKQQQTTKARQDQMAAIVGDVQAAEMVEVVKGMDDAAFGIIMKSLGASVKKEEQAEMFQEKGVSGEADVQKAVDPLSRLIAEKYGK